MKKEEFQSQIKQFHEEKQLLDIKINKLQQQCLSENAKFKVDDIVVYKGIDLVIIIERKIQEESFIVFYQVKRIENGVTRFSPYFQGNWIAEEFLKKK